MRVSRLGFLVLLLVAPVALAQVQVIAVNVNGNIAAPSGSYTYQLLKNTCEVSSTNIPINWAAQTNDLIFWTFDSTCGGSTPDGGSVNTIPSQSNVTGSGTIQKSASIYPTQILSAVINQPVDINPCNNIPPPVYTVYVCVTQQVTNLYGNSTTLTWYMTLAYNMNPPPPPTEVAITPGDTNLLVSFNYDATSIPASYFMVYAQPDDTQVSDAEGNCTPSPDAGAGSGLTDPTTWPVQQKFSYSGQRVNNLTIGQCYDVVVQAFAVDDTAGLPSRVVTAAPIEVLDYWRLYHLEGGQDPGGLHCQEAGGGAYVLALLAPLFWHWRRKRAHG